MTRLGINWPNRPLVPDDLPRMRACGFADYVVYLTDLDQLDRDLAAVLALKGAQPEARVHLRIERRGALDVAADFQALSRVAHAFARLADSLAIRNEPTLESPGLSLAGWTVYLATLGEIVKAARLPVPIFAPPLSPGSPRFADWLAATASAAAGRFAGLWVHAYGTAEQVGATLRLARSCWAGRLICTESNPGAGQRFSLGDWAAAIPKVLALSQELGIEAVCLFTWEWWKPDLILPTSVNVKGSALETFLQTWRQPVSTPEFASPNHDGPRSSTVGVVIHATLGPSSSPASEYAATIGWFQDPASQVSAHAVVGPGGQVHRSVRPELIAWHCRASNQTWLGIEMAQPFRQFDQPIGADILDAAAKVVAGWCADYKIPLRWSTVSGLAEHHEMPTNTDGHQDVGGPFDRADFLARVQAHSVPEDDLTDQQKAAVLDHLNVMWGESKAETIAANPAESERALHERIIAIKNELGLNG